MPQKKTAESAALENAKKVFSAAFPKELGYSLFVRGEAWKSRTAELYARKTIHRDEEGASASAHAVDRKGRLAYVSVGSALPAEMRRAAEEFDPAAFSGVPGKYRTKPVSKKSFPLAETFRPKAADAAYSAFLPAARSRLSALGRELGVKFRLESLSVSAAKYSNAFWSSAGGKCREDLPARLACSGEVTAEAGENRDEAYFSATFRKWGAEAALRELEEAAREAADAVRKTKEPFIAVRGNVRFDAKLFMALLGELESHLSVRWAKEGMSLAVGKDGKPTREFSKLLTVELVAADGTPYDQHLSGKGREIPDRALLKAGKVACLAASEDDLDKYGWPESKAAVGQPVTRVAPGAADISDAETDFVLLNLNALHNLNARTLEVNLTGSGYVLENGKRRFSSNLVLKANLLDLFSDVAKMGKAVRRMHDWSCPDALVRVK